jgi:hypothetical protein
MSVDIELRKAAAYISAGKIDTAHSLLSEYLRDFPDSDLAWLLLSYTIEDPRKQMASVSRALRLNPENSKAKARLEKLSEKMSDQFSEGQDSSRGSTHNWPSYYPDQESESKEWLSQPLSIEDRLAFVTLEADSPRVAMPRNYPTESFLDDATFGRHKDRGIGEKRQIRPKQLLIGGALSILLILVVMVVIKFLNGGFISRADAQATASVATAVALETKEAKGRLPPTWTPTITPTLTNTPIPSATPSATASPTPDQPNPTVEAEIQIVQQQVSDLRELPMVEEVHSYIIMRTEVRALLEAYYTSIEGSQEQTDDTSIVLVALGLIRPNYDLLTNVLNSLTDSVGGFYLHEINQVYIIGYRFTAIEKFIYAHEFDHALVDQHYNLGALNLYPYCEGNEDRCKAIQALVEGDANLLMTQWLTQVATATEYETILNYHPPVRTLSEQNPPPFAKRNGEFPYDQGLTFVDELFAQGGWSRVNQAYSNLPTSTEQILHPEKYFAGEAPLNVSSVSLGGVLTDPWRLVRNNTLGEWMTYLILGYSVDSSAQVSELDAVRASEGWGGDNYQVYHNEETGDTALAVHWKWDTAADEDEFTDIMRLYLEERFSGGVVESTSGECWEATQQVSCLYFADRQNLWIVAPSMDEAQSIKNLYSEFH